MLKIEINGTNLEYADQGEGQPVVLVHGSASDYRTWHFQKEAFADRYRVINYSRRYHWPNQQIPMEADYSMLEHVDDLRALIQEVDAAPAHLIGHSYGAYLSLLLAIRHPDLVRTLVLAEPPVVTLFVSNDPKPVELLKLLFTRPQTALAIIKFGAKGMTPARAMAKRGETKEAMRLFGATIMRQTYYSRLSQSQLEQVDANAIKAEFLGSGFIPLDEDQVRNVRTPTLLVTAQHSNRMFHFLVDRLEELLQNSERVEVEDASHIMHEDNPSAFNQKVVLFLNKHLED